MYEKIEVSRWGEGIVETLAKDLQRAFPDMRGFSAQNLWRMKQIYETYKDHEKLSALLRELPWSHNVLIVHHTSSIEEKEFYIKICVSERWSFRELQRQIESSLYERFMLSKKADKLIPRTKEKGFLAHFKDEYVFDFLGLKDEEVVRIAISRTVSAMKVVTYRTKVIDKELLKKKLHSLPLPEEYLDEDKLRCRS